MMRTLHHQFGYRLKLLHNININQNFNFFSTLSQAFLPPEDLYLPIRNQRKARRELANLLQFSDSAVPLSHFKKIHAHIVLLGFHQDVFIANILLDKYSKGGFLSDAHNLFDTMPERNLITWSSMVSMYTQHNYNAEALRLFCGFGRSSGHKANEYILASVIRACTQLGSLNQALQIHSFVVKASKSSVTWTTIIAGYIKHGRSDVSLSLFTQMLETDVSPDRLHAEFFGLGCYEAFPRNGKHRLEARCLCLHKHSHFMWFTTGSRNGKKGIVNKTSCMKH